MGRVVSKPPVTIDIARIMDDARALAFPRYPGTEGDARAIAFVEGAMREAGLEVECEEFSYDIRPAFRALRTLMISAAVLVGLAAAVAGRFPLGSALALAVAIVVGGVFLVWAPGLERIYRGDGPTRTANVVGRRRASEPRMTLVLLAHHDSKSQSLTMLTRGGLTLLAILATLGLVGVIATLVIRDGSPFPAWLAPALGATAAAALLVLATLRSGNLSPGGVDNAGSVAILLELARRLPASVPPDVELIFLSPGAEEDHMVGAMRRLDRHLEELCDRPLYALNLDGAGIPGRVALLERYGWGRLFAPRLSETARTAAHLADIRVRGVLMPPAMGIDAIPFAHRGIECLTLASGSLGRASLAVHSSRDVAENLDEDALGRVARLTEAVALEVAALAQSERSEAPESSGR